MIAWFQTRALPRFQNGYASVVRWAIGHPALVMVGMMVLFFGSFAAVGLRGPKVAFFPKGDPKFVYTYLNMPVGTRVEVTDSVTKMLENRIYGVIGRNNPDVESVITNVAIGATDGTEGGAPGVSQSHLGKVGVAFKELSERTGPATSKYMDEIREVVKGIPGTEVSVDQEASGPPTGKEIAIEVAGDDYVELAKLSKKVTRYIDSLNIGGVEQLRSNLEDRNPEIAVNIDRARANREGISTAQIGMEVRTAIYGSEASKFKTPDDEYPIQVRYAKPYRDDVNAIVNAPLTFRDATGPGAAGAYQLGGQRDLRHHLRRHQAQRREAGYHHLLQRAQRLHRPRCGAPTSKQALETFPTPPGYDHQHGRRAGRPEGNQRLPASGRRPGASASSS